MCTTAATSFTGLLIARMFLDAFEATILPSFILITQMWWIRREQSYRTIAYQVCPASPCRHQPVPSDTFFVQIANSCAAIIGPFLAYGIGKATGSSHVLHQYQGIFLFIGCISFAFVPLV